jgi:hypothetical protein
MPRKSKLTSEQQAARKYVMMYISDLYLEAFNQAVGATNADSRSEYIKAVILQDLVRRELLAAMEVPRNQRYLLEM